MVLIRRLQTGAVRLPRGSWPLGRIVACHPGTDGVVRRITVMRPDRKKMEVVPHHLVLVFRPEEDATASAPEEDAAEGGLDEDGASQEANQVADARGGQGPALQCVV